jgi:hypothetical protein
MASQDLGTLNANPIHKNSTSGDALDIYKFTIGGASSSNFNLAIHSLSSSSGNPRAMIFRDSNNSGVFDKGDFQFDPTDSGPGNFQNTIHQELKPGTYFAVVKPTTTFLGSYSIDFSNTAPKQASNIMGASKPMGSISNSFDFGTNNQVSATRTSELYSFSLGKSFGATFMIDGLTDDADMRLINDKNDNHIVDDGEVISSSIHGGAQPDSLSISGIGNYFLEVYQFSGNASYKLHVKALSILF